MSQAILITRQIKSRRWFYLLIILTTILLCIITCFQLLEGCLFWTCVSERDFSVLDLSIPADLLPPEATISKMHYPRERDGAIEAGHMNIFWQQGEGNTNYLVWRFASEWRAEGFLDFLNELDRKFDACPADLQYTSSYADEFSIACGISRFGGYRAHLNARYEEFVVAISTAIDDEMSLEEFEKIIAFIDEDLGNRLNP